MRRINIQPRADWPAIVQEQGLTYYTTQTEAGPVDVWNESACYILSARQVDQLAEAAEEVHGMCLKAVDVVILQGLWDLVGVPERFVPLVQRSWADREPHLYGRFDFAYDGSNAPKLMEYNADTPTALLEAAVIQWYWLQDRGPEIQSQAAGVSGTPDQFNSLHEDLIARWKVIASMGGSQLHLASMESDEDVVTTAYLADTAAQAGLQVDRLTMEQIGWQANRRAFVDMQGETIGQLFKLYPWEWLFSDEFGQNIPLASTRWIEPAWKAILSSKGILPVLYNLFPDSPYLLPASTKPLGGFEVRKPLRSREGANITLLRSGVEVQRTGGPYATDADGDDAAIYQRGFELPVFGSVRPVMGVWMIGEKAGGLGIREDASRITTNLSAFVPHLFVP